MDVDIWLLIAGIAGSAHLQGESGIDQIEGGSNGSGIELEEVRR